MEHRYGESQGNVARMSPSGTSLASPRVGSKARPPVVVVQVLYGVAPRQRSQVLGPSEAKVWQQASHGLFR